MALLLYNWNVKLLGGSSRLIREQIMAKLSEQLADLSVRAKHAEDALSAAQKEAHDKVMVRRDEARAAATAAIEKVDRSVKSAGDNLKSAGDAATRKWTALQTKIADDLQSIKSGIVQKKHELDVRRADNQADRLEFEAELAVDYAIAAVEQAELAVLDAVPAVKRPPKREAPSGIYRGSSANSREPSDERLTLSRSSQVSLEPNIDR
jgi:hypothetical protein